MQKGWGPCLYLIQMCSLSVVLFCSFYSLEDDKQQRKKSVTVNNYGEETKMATQEEGGVKKKRVEFALKSLNPIILEAHGMRQVISEQRTQSTG